MISFNNVSKQYGTKILYKNASFQINPGEKIGLVGPNGAGKSTVFRILAGEEGVEEGNISKPDRVRMSYFSQDVGDMRGKSALEEVKTALPGIEKVIKQMKHYEEQLALIGEGKISEDEMMPILEKYGEAQSDFERMGGYDLESRAQEILTGLGIGPEDYNRPTESFSGGWKMRIALAKVLVQNPDVLLIDEPTNHLDMESIIWLEQWLIQFKGAVVMISHDRDFMNRIVSRIFEIANKAITLYSGNYDFYERERSVRLEQLKAAHARQQEMLAKEEEFIARFAARASHAAQVQSRVKKIEKIERIEIPTEERTMEFEFPEPPRGGDEVVRFEGLSKIWQKDDGAEKLVFSNATALVKRLERVAVVGVNGAGKSTLLKIIAGHTQQTNGFMQVGASIKIGYFSQSSLEVLDENSTIFDEVQSYLPNAGKGTIHSLLGAFNFSGEEVEKKIKILSGGEKSRVVLATILAQQVNFLILDEPTNHLDIKSREVLLKALKEFKGTIMIVSHDRHFLRSLTTRVFEVDKQQLIPYEGDFDYYLWKKANG